MTGAERDKVGYGPSRDRTRGADCALRFGDCALCLSQCIDAVASPSGTLFCRPCILSNIITQRTALATRLLLWEDSNHLAAGASTRAAADIERDRIAQFVASESGASGGVTMTTTTTGGGAKRPRVDERSTKEIRASVTMASPWVPGHYDETIKSAGAGGAGASSAGAKPDTTTRDPVSGVPLKAKQLVVVRLSLAGGGEGGGGGGATTSTTEPSSSFICPTCTEPLVLQQTMLLVPCGHVICVTCISAAVATSKLCSVCGTGPLTKQDFIPLVRTGGGYTKE